MVSTILVGILGAGLFIGGWQLLLRLYGPSIESTSSLPKNTASDLIVNSPRIKWDFRGFLGMTGGQGVITRVGSFQARGENISNGPIHKFSGFIRSNITNEIYSPLLLDNALPEDTNGIPIGAKFSVNLHFNNNGGDFDKMMLEPDFLGKLSDFTLVVDLDGQREEHRFAQDKVVALVESFTRYSNPPPEPKVTLKPKQSQAEGSSTSRK